MDEPVSSPVLLNEREVFPKPSAPSSTPSPSRPSEEEEILIVDGRACVSPAQSVERKLGSLLNTAPLPLSQMRVTHSGRGHH